MEKYNYCLIISQYYYSRHSFIVAFPDNFIEVCKKFIQEIEDYKRDCKGRQYSFGDIGYIKSESYSSRYNVNDDGDIYFINSNNLNYLKAVAEQYCLTSYKESRPYQPKRITKAIEEHHEYDEIYKIVSKYFKIL